MKNIEDVIRYSEEAFKSLFYNNPEALVFCDVEGNVIDINQKFTELFGYTLEEIKGKNINFLVVPDELIEEGKKLYEISSKKGYINFETVRKRKDGTIFPVSISGSPVIINGEVVGIIGLYIDLSEKKKKEDELKFLSTHDTLTGIYNKNFLEERFKLEKVRYERFNKKFAILFLDLYEFKLINDIYGHSFGDRVLKEISQKIVNNLRKCDLVSRIGGDEFVILLTDIESEKSIMCAVNRIIKNVFENLEIDGKKLNIGVNIGISIYPDDGEELDELIKKSDIAMYHAKTIGKNTFSFYRKDIEIEKKEINIRRLETKFESIFNNIPIGILLLNKNKKIEFVNNRATEILSLEKDDIIQKDIFEVFNLKDIENKINEFFEKNLKSFSYEIDYLKSEKEKIYLRINFYNFTDEDLKIDYYLTTIEDITREKLLNHDLRRERELLSNILNNIEAVLTIEDLNGDLLYINKKGLEILECSENEAIGKNWVDYFTPENHKEKMKNFYKDLKEGKIEEFRIHINPIKTKSGKEKIVLCKNSLIEDKDGKPLLLSTGLDITDEIKLQKEFKEKEEILNKLFDASTEIIFLKDLNFKYIMANKIFSDLFNLPPEKILNSTDFDLFPYEEAILLREIDKEIINEKKIKTYEYKLTINGEEHFFRTTKTPIYDENGEVKGICGFALDITELKLRETEKEELIEALKDELYLENKLREISIILNSQRDMNSLLNLFLEEIEKIVPSAYSNIAFLEDSKLVNKAVRGYEKFGVEEFVKNLDFDLKNFPVDKKVIESKKPYIIYDTRKEKDWIVLNETSYIKSHLMIPIVLRDKVIGVVRLDGDKENQFSNKDLDKLTLLCNALGLAIENVKNLEKTKTFLENIMILVSKLSELKDPYTAGHQKNVTDIATKIALKMNLKEDSFETIKYSAILHDIGKIILPYEILTKPFKLSEREFELVKEHPKYGYELLKDLDLPYPIADIVLQHHERLNGSGYPLGLKDDDILLEARIIAVADVFDAMKSHRTYRPAHPIEVVLNELISNKGILYDPLVVDALLELYKENKLI
jgi:diguanylate cyclase (GGDEF)-like protein/PAS domain S-box-containing protein